MDSKWNVVIATAVVLTFLFGIVTYTIFQNPPEVPESSTQEEEGEGGGQSSILEADGVDIDPAKKGSFSFKVQGMNSEEMANEVNTAIQSPFEGSVGKVIANLETEVFTMEFDNTVVSEEKILEALSAAGLTVEPAPEQENP